MQIQNPTIPTPGKCRDPWIAIGYDTTLPDPEIIEKQTVNNQKRRTLNNIPLTISISGAQKQLGGPGIGILFQMQDQPLYPSLS